MTATQKEKLSFVFNKLTDEQKKLELLHLPYNEFENILTDKDAISIEVSDAVRNRSIFSEYSGVIALLRVSKNEVILKPNLIKEILK